MKRIFDATVKACLMVALFCLSAAVGSAQQAQSSGDVAFEKIEAMIPMRDGVRLNTVILAPKNSSEPLPILMLRTPYGVGGWSSERVNRAYQELVADGYIFVFQDIRGKNGSEGEFRMNRPP